MPLYTLIAYKPDSTDTCMGCLMASYSSDFEGFTSHDAHAIARRWAKLMERQNALKPEFARIQDLAEAELEAMHAEAAAKEEDAARRKAEAEEAARRRAAEEKEARERAEFERLTAKFGKGGSRA